MSMDYEKLYTAYYMQVYSYIITLARNRDLAEEITQNTFYKAVTAKAQFSGLSDQLTWLCSIAKNLYYDELRKKRNTVGLDEIGHLASEESVERMAADSDMAFRIHLVLHRLEEPYKEVFTLRVLGSLSFKKISDIFGKTESWARVTFYRAKVMIKESIDNE